MFTEKVRRSRDLITRDVKLQSQIETFFTLASYFIMTSASVETPERSEFLKALQRQ